MAVHKLQRTQLVRQPIERVWDFFSDPHNLAAITPPYMKFRVTSDSVANRIYPGQIITYKVSPLLNIPLFWMTEITQVQHLKMFIDEQRSGPYSIWHHQHHFEAQGSDTLMTDIVHYKLPFGPLGSIAHSLFVSKQLEEIFEYRKQQVETLFNNG